MFHKTGSKLQIRKIAALQVLLEEEHGLIKDAKIQKEEKVLEKKDNSNFIYFVARAIDADIPNGNGDFFPLKEIEAAYETFVGKGLYLNHDSDDITKAVGKIIDSYLVHDEKEKRAWVECICKIDKKAHPDIARQVEVGIIDAVSMGCTCERCICSVCEKEMFTVNDFCDHIKTGLLRKFPNPKNQEEVTCYSINHGLHFNELSLVGTPADPDAKIHKVFAKLKEDKQQKIADALKDFTEKELTKLNEFLDIVIEKKANLNFDQMYEIAEKSGFDLVKRLDNEAAYVSDKNNDEGFLRFVEGKIYYYKYYGEVGTY